MMQTWENGENPHLEPNFVPPPIIYNLKKLTNQTWEIYEKPNFGFDFGPFTPHLGSQISFMGFMSSSS